MQLVLGEDFTIREFRSADVTRLVEHADNEKIARNLEDRFPHPYTLEDAEAWLAHVDEQNPPTHFAIAAADQIIGGIGFRILEDVYAGTAELGYWLGESYWGQGIATRAVLAFSSWIFESFPVERVEARVFTTNPASCRVLEKAGFTREGRLRKSVRKLNMMLDHVVYAILRDESSTS